MTLTATTLAANLAADATEMTLAAAVSDDTHERTFLVQVEAEYILVERRVARTNPQIVRGFLGTERAAHASGEAVTPVVLVAQTDAPVDPPEESGAGGGGGVTVTGEGSPVGAVTPTAGKPLYIDTTNGTLYLADGATNLDWIAVGPVDGNVGEATGFIVNNGKLYVLTNGRDEAGAREGYFGDAWSMWNGSGQGLYWRAGPGEGVESLVVKTGTGAAHSGTLQDENGDMTVPGEVNATAVNTDALVGSTAQIALDNGVVITGTAVDLNPVGGVVLIRPAELGFFGATPVPQPTGVAVTAAGIHAALVSLGLITA